MQKIRIPKPRLIEVSQLKRNPKNIKQHPEAQIHDLVKLIKMVGFKDPIVIDKNQTVWAGHGRLDAAEILKMKLVPCISLEDLDEAQKKVFMLMDNKVNESGWIRENVQLIFDEVDPMEFEDFQMKFEESFKPDFESRDVTTIDESLETSNECPKCHYKW